MLTFGIRTAEVTETTVEFLIPDFRMKFPVWEWRQIKVPPLLLASARIKTGDVPTNLQTGVKVFQELFNRLFNSSE